MQETPLELTRSVRDISVTERNSFKTCHRQWFVETVLNLEPKGLRPWYYDFGSGLHLGLEAYYKRLGGLIEEDSPLDNALAAFEKWGNRMRVEIVAAKYGESETAILDELQEYIDLGWGMLENYSKYAPMHDDFVIVAVEGEWTEEGLNLLEEFGYNPPYDREFRPILHDESGRILTPIVNPDNGHPVGYDLLKEVSFLSAKLDLVIYSKKTGYKGFWIYDHKSAGQSPNLNGLEMDDQPTGYSYTFWRLTGIVPRGTFFNYLIKQVPNPPRLVREGTQLSSAKDQITTAEWYREALVDFNLITDGRVTSEKHAECYQALLSKGWDRFFQRAETHRSENELYSFEARLERELLEMQEEGKKHLTQTHPHLNQYGACGNCSIRRICKAVEDGSDYEDVIEIGFRQAEDRKAHK